MASSFSSDGTGDRSEPEVFGSVRARVLTTPDAAPAPVAELLLVDDATGVAAAPRPPEAAPGEGGKPTLTVPDVSDATGGLVVAASSDALAAGGAVEGGGARTL